MFAVSQTGLGVAPRRIRVDANALERGGKARRVAMDGPGTELLEAGRPIMGLEVAAYDERRQRLPDSTIGEIGIRGSFLFSGYQENPELTAERLMGDTYFSRDLGFILDGHVYVLGRIDDLIIVNGRSLYAHDIEAVIGNVDGVKPGRSVAVGGFDERVGSERLVIVSERARSAMRSGAELRRDIIRVVYSTFEVTPWRVHLVEEGWLIKTTSGKISRAENLTRLQAADFDGIEAK